MVSYLKQQLALNGIRGTHGIKANNNQGTEALYSNIIFVNSWQFGVSLLYLTSNAFISYLLVGNEWAGFAKKRKTLRVTSPEGIQRSTYFVSIPLRYGIPLMLSMVVLHWTLSQSIFVIRIAAYNWDGSRDTESSISAVAFSPIAVIACRSCSKYRFIFVISLTDIPGLKLKHLVESWPLRLYSPLLYRNIPREYPWLPPAAQRSALPVTARRKTKRLTFSPSSGVLWDTMTTASDTAPLPRTKTLLLRKKERSMLSLDEAILCTVCIRGYHHRSTSSPGLIPSSPYCVSSQFTTPDTFHTWRLFLSDILMSVVASYSIISPYFLPTITLSPTPQHHSQRFANRLSSPRLCSSHWSSEWQSQSPKKRKNL